MANVLDAVLTSSKVPTHVSTEASEDNIEKLVVTAASASPTCTEAGPSGSKPAKQEKADLLEKPTSPMHEALSRDDLEYIVRHDLEKQLPEEQIVEVQHYTKDLKYPRGSLIHGGNDEDDFLYYLPDNKEINVCREMMDNMDYPKLELGLSAMTKDQLADSLAYNNLKVCMFLFLHLVIFDRQVCSEQFVVISSYYYLYIFVCQGLILSKALKAQKDAEDKSTQIAFGDLCSEVITLRNEALENDKILLSLVEILKSSETRLASLSEVEQRMEKFKKKLEADEKRIADLEYALSIQVGLHRSKVQGLEKRLDEVTENFNVEQAKREISNSERLRVQKNVKELFQEKVECYNVAMKCCNKLKNSFAKVGAFSMEQNFICGDPNGVIQWIAGEAEVFDEILSDRGDFCDFAGARGAVSLLEKAGCEHAKAVIQPEFSVLVSDIKDPSSKAIALSGKFYSEVWLEGGQEIGHQAIRKNEKESHTALEEARKAEKAAERKRLIGIFVVI
jgi:hypothetical protein